MAELSRIYQFGDCELNLEKRQLERAGEVVEVQSQVFDLLCYLAANSGKVLDKRTLLSEVWNNTFLSDASISQAIRKARRAVGDDGNAQRIIRTVHGKGFMLVVPCTLREGAQVAPATRTPPKRLRTGMLVVFVASAAILAMAGFLYAPAPTALNKPTIAIFAFTDQTQNSDGGWLSMGLAETVALLLESGGNLHVRHPNDHQALPQSPLKERALALGVDYALDARITDGNEQFTVQYRMYRKNQALLDGSFQTHDTSLIARQLSGHVTDAIADAPTAPVPERPLLTDPLALELYGQGMQAIYREQKEQAVAYLNAASAREPESVPITVALAIARFDHQNLPESLEQYRQVRAALPAHAVLGRARMGYEIGTELYFQGSVKGASEVLESVLADASEQPFLHAMVLNSLSMVRHSQLQFERSWELARQAENISASLSDPFHYSMVLSNLGYMAEDLGRLAQAKEFHGRALAIREQFDFPTLVAASRYALARVERRSGRFEQARHLLEQALDTARRYELPFDEFDNLEELAEVQMRLGAFASARQTLQTALKIAQENDDRLGVAWASQVFGRLALRTGSVDEHTIVRQQQALDDLQEMGEGQDAFTTQLELAHMYRVLGDYTAASGELKKLQASLAVESPVLQLRVLHLAAWLGAEEPRLAAFLELVSRARAIGVLDVEAEYALQAGNQALESRDLETARRMLTIASAWSADYYRTRQLRSSIAQIGNVQQ